MVLLIFLQKINFTFLGEDSMDYLSTAINLSNGEGFVSNEHNPSHRREHLGDNYYFTAEPLWAILLSIFIYMGFNGIVSTILANTFMYSVLLYLSYLIGKSFNLNKKILFVFLLLLILNPHLQFWSFKGMSEILRINTFLFFTYMVISLYTKKNIKFTILLGLSSASLLLSKITFLFMPIFAIPILIPKDNRINFAILYLIIIIITISPWVFRNYNDFGLITLDPRLNTNMVKKTLSKDQFLTLIRIKNKKVFNELRNNNDQNRKDQIISEYNNGIQSWLLIYALQLKELFKPYPQGGSFFEQYKGNKKLFQIYSFIFWIPWVTGVMIFFLKKIKLPALIWLCLSLSILSTIGIHLLKTGNHSRYMLFLIPLGYCSLLVYLRDKLKDTTLSL